MTMGLVVGLLLYTHIVAQALWVGGLFGYVLIVWPAIMHDADGAFPRSVLAQVAIRTGPWIYLAMGSALVSYLVLCALGALAVPAGGLVAYGLLLSVLVGNNVYGTVTAWPRIMLLPRAQASAEWAWFRVRMAAALGLGLASFSGAVAYLLRQTVG
ncbi:MAG: hypothetical protein ABIX28_00545 [Vicinamibacterales bacterium]